MPKQKSGNFDQGKYVAGYMRENIKQVKVSLNKNKPEDMKLYEWLRTRPQGASGYLKELARADMAKNNL